jgi:hypothetical protein
VIGAIETRAELSCALRAGLGGGCRGRWAEAGMDSGQAGTRYAEAGRGRGGRAEKEGLEKGVREKGNFRLLAERAGDWGEAGCTSKRVYTKHHSRLAPPAPS